MPLSHLHLHHRDDSNQDIGKLAAEMGNQPEKRDAVKVTVYVTADPTFKGKVAGYSTVGKEVKATQTAKKEKATATKEEEAKTTAKAKATDTAKSNKEKTTSKEEEKAATTKEKSKAVAKTEETEVESKTTKTAKDRSKTTATKEDTSSVPSAITDAADTATESVLAQATDDFSMSTTFETSATKSVDSALSSSSASAAAAASTSSGGSSAGTKAGIAFGVLGGIFLVGMLVFFVFSRRRKQAERQRLEDDDEKLNGPIGPIAPVDTHFAAAASTTPRADPKAPRISLRPVTQFLPNWNLEKRTSKGAAMALAVPAAGSPMTSRAPGGSAWDRPSTAQSTDPSNPFGAQAERVPTPIMEESIRARSTTPNSDALRPVSPVSSIGTMNTMNDPLTASGPQVAVAVAAATGAGSATLARKTSMRKDGPKKLDLTLPNPPMAPVPPSPSGTEFSISSASPGATDAPSSGAAAIAAAGGPVNSAVHRVQLDFNPTLDDELDMKAGDLVRLLHEYDDGWALCIRLDRSKQGVVPRTCLSTRPVKPRPAQAGPRPGPPVNPNGPPRGPMGPPGQRPMTPQGMQAQGRPASPAGRPMTPNGGRSQSPMGRPMNPPGRPAGRPMSPGPRSQSPGPRQGPPQGRPMSPGPRSQSPGPRQGLPGGRNSPPGRSPMNPTQEPRQGPPAGPPTGPVGRKPVPGQAY